jgi:hypothetical protein
VKRNLEPISDSRSPIRAKKSMKKMIGTLLLLLIITCTAIFTASHQPSGEMTAVQTAHARYESAKIERKIRDIDRNANLSFYGIAGLVSSICLTLLIIGSGIHRAVVKKAKVHTYRIGKHNEIVIHEKDLSLAAPVALGLMNAEQLKQMNGGLDKAMELYSKLADVQTQQIQALVGKSGVSQARLEAPALAAGSMASLPPHAPSFAEMLRSGNIHQGAPLTFGFDKATGRPQTGVLHDLYSTITIGLSGAGKSTYICYLIACSILLERAQVVMLDFHYPAPESLGYMLDSLIDAGYVHLESNPSMVNDLLSTVEQELDRRLSVPAEAQRPFILCVDEHERWAVNQKLIDLEIRLVNEGRKVKMYLFITSKSAKADKIGDSALRDNMITSFVFATKKANARTFFKDEDKVKLLKQVTPPGEAIYTNRRDESIILQTPLATRDDIVMVANMLEPVVVNRQVNTSSVNLPVNQGVNPANMGDEELVNHVKRTLKPGDLTALAERCGVSKPYLSNVLNGKKPPSAKVKTELIDLLQEETGTDNVIPFRRR